MATNEKKPALPKRFINWVVKFFRDSKSEVKKVSWPTFKQVRNNTFVVIVICVLLGAVIWVLDAVLSLLMSLVA